MLAIQLVKITYHKDMRTPQGAAERRRMLAPKRLECPDLSGEGVFVSRHLFAQTSQGFEDGTEMQRRFFEEHYSGDEMHRALRHLQEFRAAHRGVFVSDIRHIPQLSSISVLPSGECWHIMWHSDLSDSGNLPIRRGHNEGFADPDSPFAGNTILNETAFELSPGESGRVLYNYRNNSGDVPHYELYCAYFVNTCQLTESTFTAAEYKYEYRQLAKLF